MATGQEVLAHYKLTVEQANEFILANIEQSEVIFNRPLKNYLRCRYGVKNRLKMLIYRA